MNCKQKLSIATVFILAGLFNAASAAEKCQPTPEKPMGNSYLADTAVMKVNVGKGLTIRGQVLSATNCEPIADAIIEHWQAGNKGTYEKSLRAFTFSLPDGHFEFETEWPNMPIPHIHFIVTADNHKKLITQWIPDSKTDSATFNLVLKPALSF